jgi:hypothetical protein
MMKRFFASHIIITLNLGIVSILNKVTNLHFQFIYIPTIYIDIYPSIIVRGSWLMNWKIDRQGNLPMTVAVQLQVAFIIGI